MGTGIGDYAENTVLFEAACSRDPVLRLAGVNRALEGLAIDVFTTMKEFGDVAGDPVLEFCEDWMLADEVTHVKMGSDWLRRLTATDPERRKAALEFQQVVDKLFSNAGARSDSDESAIGLARRFRELAGFSQRRDRRDRRGVGGGARRGQGASPARAGRGRHRPGRPPRRGQRPGGALMAVTVTPAEFTFVQFDAGVIRAAVEELLDRLGMADRDLQLEVDESSPIARVQVEAGRPAGGGRPRAAPSRTPASRGSCRRSPSPPPAGGCCCACGTGRRASRTRRATTTLDAAPGGGVGRLLDRAARPASATRSTGSAGSTTSATGTASPTPATAPSRPCGPPTTSRGPSCPRPRDAALSARQPA